MQFENVSIMGLSYVDAPHCLTSAEIEDRIAPTMRRFRAPEGLLASLTGIHERRLWDEGMEPSDAATLAARKLLDETGFDANDLGILINTSVSRTFIEPSIASWVHGNLKLPESCMNFDIANACLGFMNGIQLIANMIEMGQVKFGMVVNAETARHAYENTIQRILDPDIDLKRYRLNFPTLTLGSGSVAMLIGHSDYALDGHKVVNAASLALTEHHKLCIGRMDEMLTDSKKLLQGGIELSVKMRQHILKLWGREPNAVDEIAIHQVSQPHTDQVIEAVGLDEDKVFRIYPKFGNVGPAGVPITVAKSIEAGRLKKGMRLGMFGIGSGLNSLALEVIW
ncbi:MAG: 3-oxoacyl-ACP synthase III [Anaerolineales bacterium]